jgi:hypothetical protein
MLNQVVHKVKTRPHRIKNIIFVTTLTEIPWSRIFPETVILLQLVKKFHVFYRTGNFVAVHTMPPLRSV